MFKYAACSFILAFLLLNVTDYYVSTSDSYAKSKTVGLFGSKGQCSGEQITSPHGKTYILSAGHCRNIEIDGYITVRTETGVVWRQKIVAEDKNSDLLLLEGIPNMSGLTIAANCPIGGHIRTFTHGGGFPTYKTDGLILGKIPVSGIKNGKGKYWAATNALIIPGSSGGMIVNDYGELVAVADATDFMLGYLVPLSDIKAFLEAY